MSTLPVAQIDFTPLHRIYGELRQALMSGKFEPGQKLASRKLAATLGTSDMPVLTVEANGKASKAVTVPHLTLADAKGRSIMIHAGGDNYFRPACASGRRWRAHRVRRCQIRIANGSSGTIGFW